MGMVRGPYTTCVSKLGEIEGSMFLNIRISEYRPDANFTHVKAQGFVKMMGIFRSFDFYELRLADHIFLMTTPVMKSVQGETNSTAKNMALIGKLSEALR